MTTTPERAREVPLTPSTPDRSSAMTAARAPVGVGATPLVATVTALLLIALGTVGVQEALVRTGTITAPSWTSETLGFLDGLEPVWWMLPLFALMVLTGLLLLLLAFRRRPRKTLTLSARTGVYLRTKDLARIVEDQLEGTRGVTDVNATVSRSRLRIELTTLEPKSDNKSVADRVRERLAPTLDTLSTAPKVKINLRNETLA